MKKILIICSALSLMACTGADHAGHDHDTHSHTGGHIVISDARVRPPLPGQHIAAGYFQLSSDQADKLIAVTSPVSPRTELHTHIDDKGIMRMRRVNGGIDIAAGEDVIFEPGGFHVMLFDTDIPADTKDIALTFDFETAPDVTIIADIISGSASYGSDHKSHGSGEGSESSHGSDHISSHSSGQ